VLEFASFTANSGRSKSMQLWSLAKVFHTCGKNCGKSRGRGADDRYMAEKAFVSPAPPSLDPGEYCAKPMSFFDDYPKK
jgi:hypothetical protein